MDPNAVLQQLLEALKEADESSDRDDAYIALLNVESSATDLIEWLAKGGFPPDWAKIYRKVNG